MKRPREKLSGVFAPVVTPFQDDELALDGLRENLRKLAQSELTGYFALGSNGEFRSLTEREELRVLEIFLEEKSEKVVMVGTGCESTRLTVEKTRRAAEMGFPFASIITPSYFARQTTDECLTDHYLRIAESSPIPILLYNAPGFAGGVTLSLQCVSRLATHENIVGIKDSSSAGPGNLLAQLDPSLDFCVLAGSADFFYPSLMLGAVGGILSSANYLPDLSSRLFGLFLQGSYGEALELHSRLVRINRAVSGTFGVSGVKAAMDLLGFHGLEPRHPLRRLSDTEREEIRKRLQNEGIAVEP
jgi:4-hydroxy-2-oxoglutarate aldolase